MKSRVCVRELPTQQGHPMWRALRALCALCLATLLVPSWGHAAAGDLDRSFNGSGMITTGFPYFPGPASGVVVDDQNRIVVGGYGYKGDALGFNIARYGSNGGLDSSFGQGGLETLVGFGSNGGYATALAGDGDRIVMAGWQNRADVVASNILVTRSLSGGQPDLDFGYKHSGGVIGEFLQRVEVRAMAIDAAHSIVLAGCRSPDDHSPGDLMLIRILSNGTLDTNFGISDGMTHLDLGHDECANAVAIDQMGGIVVAGYQVLGFSGVGGFDENVVIARFDANGKLDTTFGQQGSVVRKVPGTSEEALAIGIDGRGRIIVAGYVAQQVLDSKMIVMRFDAKGKPDAGFGDAGISQTDFGPGVISRANALAIDAKDRIVLAGSVGTVGGKFDFAVALYDANGKLDLGVPATVAGRSGPRSPLARTLVSRLQSIIAARSWSPAWETAMNRPWKCSRSRGI